MAVCPSFQWGCPPPSPSHPACLLPAVPEHPGNRRASPGDIASFLFHRITHLFYNYERQAVMASRIGASTAMVGCLGEDANGESYMQSLAGDGIDCSGVRRDAGAPTGVAQVDGWMD